MEALSKIFGSAARVKIMRLFLFNTGTIFTVEDVASRSRVPRKSAEKEMNLLHSIEFLKPKSENRTEKKKGVEKEITVDGYTLNKGFVLHKPFANLLIDSEMIHNKELLQRLKDIGRIKLLALSGIFMKDPERSIDLLIVGDRLDKRAAMKTIQSLEAEIGKELRYSIFDVEEFTYRIDMYDKLIRDIFDFPHEMVINKLEKINLTFSM